MTSDAVNLSLCINSKLIYNELSNDMRIARCDVIKNYIIDILFDYCCNVVNHGHRSYSGLTDNIVDINNWDNFLFC